MAIDPYREQIGTPSGGIESRVSPIVNPAADINLQDVARGFANLAQAKEESDANNARAELASLEPQAQLAFQTEYNRIESSWAPGQKPIAVQMQEYIQKYTNDVETKLSNRRAVPLIQARSKEFQTHYMLKGGADQLNIERDIRIGQYQKGYDDNSIIGANNPMMVGRQLAILNASVMADDQIPLVQRQQIIKNGSSQVAMATAKVQAEADPQMTMAVTGKLLGLTQPELNIPGEGDLISKIAQLESGNRLYDASGKILRGPAISTAEGKTIYAYGKYQLLESVAKSQAKELGIPWKPEVFFREQTGNAQLDRETSDYHDQLGKSHIANNLNRFGNPIVAAAAHNMGPTAAEGWAAGRPYQTQSGKWWRPSKPMDLNSMPAETRKYIEGLGEISEKTPTVDVGDEYSTAFRLLTPEQLLSIRGSAESNLAAIHRQQRESIEIQKGFFEQKIRDLTSAGKAGDDFTLPSDEEFALLGPVKGALEKQRLSGLKVMAGQLNSQQSMDNASLEAMTVLPDPEGIEDRENRQIQTNALRDNAKSILSQRAADPGKAAAQSNQVRTASLAWAQAANDFYTAGKNATPEQLDAVNNAQAGYVTASFSVQKQWGITQPMLPKSMAESIGGGFNQMLRDGNYQGASARMVQLQKAFGSSYDAIEQVARQTGDVGRFAMEGIPPGVIGVIHAAKQIAPDDLNKQLGGIKPADVQTAVATSFAPLLSSLNATGPDGVGDTATASRYFSGGVLLAKSYLASGKASSPKEAAQMAYADLYTNRETVTAKGLRVPNTYNPDEVQAGYERHTSQLQATDIQVPEQVGLTPEESAASILRNIQRNGRWVTDETGEGAYLLVAGRPVLNSFGQPMRVTYQQAINMPNPYQGQIEAPIVPSIQGLR